MAFDAGAIEGTVTLDRTPFIKGMQLARKEAQDFQNKKWQAIIGVQLDGAEKARLELDKLGKNRDAKIKVDIDKPAITRARQETDAFGGSLTKLAVHVWSIKTLASGFKSLLGPALLATKAIGVAGAAGAAVALGGGAISAIGPLSSLAGLAPLLAAGMGAAAVAMGTMKLATENVGKAIQLSAKGGAAFQAQLAKLAPAAQSFVLEIRALKPAFDTLQLGVQQQFFAGLSRQISTTATTLLPQLRRGLVQVAGGLSGVAGTGLSALRTSFAGEGLEATLGNISRAIRAITPAVGAMVSAFAKIGRVGTLYLAPVAGAVSNLAVRFNEFIQHAADTGDLGRFIQGGISAFRTLAGIVGNLGLGLANVVKAAAPLGEIVFGKLSLISKAFSTITGSASGQKALKNFFDSLQPVLATIGQLAETLGKALAPLIPVVLTIANSLGKALIPIVKDLGPGLGALGQILIGLVGPLGKIVDAVAQGLSGALAGLVPLIQPVAKAFNALAPVLGALVEDILTPFPALLGLVANVLSTLAPAITPLLGVIGNLINIGFKALAPVVIIVARAVAQLVTQGLKALAPYLPIIQRAMVQLGQALAADLAPLLPVIVKSFVQLLAAVLPVVPVFLRLLQSFEPVLLAFTQMAAAVLPVFVRIITPIAPYLIGLAAAWWLVNAAMAANPIGLVITAIALLATGIYELVKHFDAVKNFFVHTIPDALRSAWPFIRKWGLLIISAIFPIALIPGLIVAFWGPISRFFSKIGSSIEGFFKGVGRWLLHIGSELVGGFWSGIKSAWNGVSDWFAHMGVRISNFFRGIASWLVGEGSHLIGGLWNGISSRWGDVSRWFAGMGRRIANFFTGVSQWIYSEGFHLISGLFNGISNRWTDVYNWFRKIPERFAGNFGWATTLVSKGSALIQGLFSGILNKLGNVKNWVKNNLFDPIKDAVVDLFKIGSPSRVMQELGGHVMGGFIKGLLLKDPAKLAKNLIGSLPRVLGSLVSQGLVKISDLSSKGIDAITGLGGSFADLFSTTSTIGGKGSPGAAAYAGVIDTALKMLGQSTRWLPIVEKRLNQESGGNATIVNKWDSNWIAGHPSVGLMQVIAGTFAKYAGPFKNIGPKLYGVSTNALANIYAGLNYAIHRYGSLSALLRPGGYAGGGIAKAGELAWTSEQGRELMHFQQPAVIYGHQKSENMIANMGGTDIDYQAFAEAIASELSKLDFTTTLQADHVALARVVKKGNMNLAWLGG